MNSNRLRIKMKSTKIRFGIFWELMKKKMALLQKPRKFINGIGQEMMENYIPTMMTKIA